MPARSSTERLAEPSATESAGTGVRTDIQGLRAIAVAAVLGYHLWPNALTGGYVGVDVFLVISGYLITAHLLRDPPDDWRAVGRFWGRRVRRLLPASAVVVLATVAAAALVLPATQLRQTADEAISSALYVQNWALAGTATDYLAAEGVATAFRHYWSLSVEEQFYLVWPLLIGAAFMLGRRRGRRRGARDPSWPVRAEDSSGGPAARQVSRQLAPVAGIVLTVLAASLAWSSHLTRVDPAAGYYVTPTRMWELALGGAVALAAAAYPAVRVPNRFGGPLALLGLGGVLVAVLMFDGATPFPGTWALLPTLGTALVIVAQPSSRSWPGRLLGTRPAQVLGDVSYSTYLWHWPLIVLVPFAIDRRLTWYELGVVAATSVALAAATKRWVEDPVRRSPRLIRSPRATTGLLVICTAGGVLAGLALLGWAGVQESRASERAEQAAAQHPDCFGAAAVLSGSDCTTHTDQLWTAPVTAAADKPQLYEDGCWNEQPYASRVSCSYGPDDADVRVALVGNSHAGSWFPPLEAIAGERGWQLTTFVASVCYPVDVPLSFDDPASTDGCRDWNAWVRDQVTAGGYDLVVMAARTDQLLADVPRDEQDAVAQLAYAHTLDTFTAAGLSVLVMRDTPSFPSSVPDCVATSPQGGTDCDQPLDTAVEADPLAAAATADRTGQVWVLDPTDVLCSADACHAVVGGTIVYFDHGHMTATFSTTLVPLVEPALDEALAARGN